MNKGCSFESGIF